MPASEGGYGKPLGNHGSGRLSGLMKITPVESGIRIVYRLIRTETGMPIVVTGVCKYE